MKLLKASLLLAAAATTTGCVIHIDGKGKKADVELQKTLSIPASNLSKFNIDAGAGYLNVRGIEGQSHIEVVADIRTTKEQDFTFSLDASGDTAFLIAEHHHSSGFWYGKSPQINLTITMPKQMLLDIEDGSGDIEIRNIDGSLFVDDGSGATDIARINGDVELDDGSGDVVLEDINGSVLLDDGSGSLRISNVTGDVEIEDGSGDLTVLNAGGTVTVDDGSGDINVDIAGGLNIIDSGSGELNISKIKGEVYID